MGALVMAADSGLRSRSGPPPLPKVLVRLDGGAGRGLSSYLAGQTERASSARSINGDRPGAVCHPAPGQNAAGWVSPNPPGPPPLIGSPERKYARLESFQRARGLSSSPTFAMAMIVCRGGVFVHICRDLRMVKAAGWWHHLRPAAKIWAKA
jgi:hypothetical protein